QFMEVECFILEDIPFDMLLCPQTYQQLGYKLTIQQYLPTYSSLNINEELLQPSTSTYSSIPTTDTYIYPTISPTIPTINMLSNTRMPITVDNITEFMYENGTQNFDYNL